MNDMIVNHDSFHVRFRDPFGAVPEDTQIMIRIQVKSREKVTSVTLRLWKSDDGEERIPMMPAKGQDGLYEAALVLDKPNLYWYYFILEIGGNRWFYSKNPDNYGGLGCLRETPSHAYQITVYQKDYRVPLWFMDGVMYQIFPDRFHRHRYTPFEGKEGKNYFLHENWGAQPHYEPDPDTGKILNNDFFGGNLEGIIKKLDYLRDLGITVLYLNPIFEAYSNHRYDVGDYKQIDPVLGDLSTFQTLCQKAKEKGICIILDGVFSHTGSDSVYFNKEGNYPSLGAYASKESPYHSWYRFKEFPDDYDCWWDVKTLPNVNELEPTFLEYIIDDQDSVIRYWLRNGAKGWRLDVADELPTLFLTHLRKAVKETDPEAVIIGEVWEDASNKLSYGELRRYLLGEQLDTAMNYPFRDAVLQFLLEHWDAERLHRAMMTLKENYPLHSFYSAMNLLGTHDVTRIRTLLSGAPPDYSLSRAQQAVYHLTPEQRSLGRDRHRLAAFIQMTFPGVPSIYYGDEAGMEGYRDPFNRGCYPWGAEESDLIDWYKNLIALRKAWAPLHAGEFIPLVHQGDLYGFIRRISNQQDVYGRSSSNGTLVVLMNRSRSQTHHIGLDLRGFGIQTLKELLGGTEVTTSWEGYFTLQIKPLSGKVFSAIHK